MAEKQVKKVRVPLGNAEAEAYLLSCILIDRTVADDVLVKLSEKDFSDKRHVEIYKAMAKLQDERSCIDFVILVDKLRKQGKLAEAGDIGYITALADKVPSSGAYQYYYNLIKRETLLRQLLEVSKDIAEDVYQSEDANESLAKAQAAILGVTKSTDTKDLTPIRDITDTVLENIEKEFANPGQNKGLKTGFPNFDQVTNGLQRSDIVLVAARPGVGKTAFALNIAANIAKRKEDKKILIFSLEMADVQLVTRMLCNVSGVSNTDIKTANLKTDDFVRLRQARDVLRSSGIYIDQTAEVSPEEIRSKCRRFKLKNGDIDLIIVDYLQLMESAKKKESRQQEVSDISRQMKLMAKELDVPVILVSQMSRMSEINGEEPQLHHLRDSGAIEQDADIVIFLHKPRNQINTPEIIKLIIAKFRNGQQTDLAFSWDGATFTFVPEDREMLKKILIDDAKPQYAKAPPSGGGNGEGGGIN